MRPNNILIKIIVCVFLIQIISSATFYSGATENNPIPYSTWKELTKEKDYTENYKEHQRKEKPVKTGKSVPFSIEVGGILRVLVYFGVFILIVFLLFLLLRYTQFFGKKVQNQHDQMNIEEVEKNLLQSNLLKLLELALKRKEYKLAVRIQYLMIIKKLSEYNLIEWKKDKTNGTYVQETINTSFGNNFKAVTTLFDKIWYGDIRVSKEIYGVVQPSFRNLMADITHET